jgi:hypothetical protein
MRNNLILLNYIFIYIYIVQPINAIGHFCVNFFKIWVKIGKTLSTPFDN